MNELLSNMLIALEYAGIGIVLFLFAYSSNMCFSIYYNIKILGQPWNKDKIKDSGFKILTFGVGTLLMTIATVGIPEFANVVGIELPQEYIEVFGTLAIAGTFIVCSCKYILEAFSKFKKILGSGEIVSQIEEKSDEEN